MIALYIGLSIANSVVRPIQKLTNFALKLSTDEITSDVLQEIDTDFDREMAEQDDEIGGLTRAFKSLVKMVQEDKKGED